MPPTITREGCESRAATYLQSEAVTDESLRKLWADPVLRLAALGGIRLGVAAVFDAMQEASAYPADEY